MESSSSGLITIVVMTLFISVQTESVTQIVGIIAISLNVSVLRLKWTGPVLTFVESISHNAFRLEQASTSDTERRRVSPELPIGVLLVSLSRAVIL